MVGVGVGVGDTVDSDVGLLVASALAGGPVSLPWSPLPPPAIPGRVSSATTAMTTVQILCRLTHRIGAGVSSIHICQSGGAGGHEGSGCYLGVGCHPSGGDGHPGAGLKRRAKRVPLFLRRARETRLLDRFQLLDAVAGGGFEHAQRRLWRRRNERSLDQWPRASVREVFVTVKMVLPRAQTGVAS
jgi:hypothetical protein